MDDADVKLKGHYPTTLNKAAKQQAMWEKAHQNIQETRATARHEVETKRESPESIANAKLHEEAHFNKWIESQRAKTIARVEKADYKQSAQGRAAEDAHFNKWAESQKKKMLARENKNSAVITRESNIDLDMIAKNVEAGKYNYPAGPEKPHRRYQKARSSR